MRCLNFLGDRASVAIAASGGWQPRFTTVKAVRFAIAVTDFDQLDNSGEPPNRRRAHKTGLADFPRSLRPDLKGGGDFRVVTIACRKLRRTAGSAARRSYRAPMAGPRWAMKAVPALRAFPTKLSCCLAERVGSEIP